MLDFKDFQRAKDGILSAWIYWDLSDAEFIYLFKYHHSVKNKKTQAANKY